MNEEKKQEERLDDNVDGVGEDTVETEQDISDENEQNLKEDYQACLEEIEGYKDKLLRLHAEFENYKKRMERDRLARMKYAGEPVLREVLSVVDNLERALAPAAEGVETEQYLAALREGVELTQKQLLSSLEKLEVKSVDAVGQPFDPNIHEAMTMEASDEIPANHVISEFEKGYQYKDRLLRVAKVIVSSGSGES